MIEPVKFHLLSAYLKLREARTAELLINSGLSDANSLSNAGKPF